MHRPLLRNLLIALSLCAASCSAFADEVVHAVGRVYSSDSKTPVSGAIVAAYDDKNHVIEFVRTESDGSYALPLRKSDLHLNKKSGGGLFHAVGNMVTSAGGLVGMPLKAGIRAAAGLAQATDPVTRIGIGAASGVAQSLVGVISPKGKGNRIALERLRPGAIVLKVSSLGSNDAVGIANTYWMEENEGRFNGKQLRAINAWLDPITLTGNSDSKPSSIGSNYFTFTEARIEPSIAEVGQTVKISVKFIAPPEPRTSYVMIARNNRTGQVLELVADSGSRVGTHSATFVVDKKHPADDQTYTIVAYADQELNPGRTHKAEDAIKSAGLFEPNRPYIYDPGTVVSRNRAEVTLTVVKRR